MTTTHDKDAAEREAFEKEANEARFFPAELCFARTKSPSGRDEYANSHLQSRWEGWQARAALAAQSKQASGIAYVRIKPADETYHDAHPQIITEDAFRVREFGWPDGFDIDVLAAPVSAPQLTDVQIALVCNRVGVLPSPKIIELARALLSAAQGGKA